MIVRVRVVLRRTVVGDWRFDNLSGSHLQSHLTIIIIIIIIIINVIIFILLLLLRQSVKKKPKKILN